MKTIVPLVFFASYFIYLVPTTLIAAAYVRSLNKIYQLESSEADAVLR
jgi:hypothetical protein